MIINEQNVHEINYIYTKNVQAVQNFYKVQTKNGLKFEIYVFLDIQTMYKLYKTYKTS